MEERAARRKRERRRGAASTQTTCGGRSWWGLGLGGMQTARASCRTFPAHTCITSLQLNERLAEKSRDERQGLDFERVPDADLFYVDKVRGG